MIFCLLIIHNYDRTSCITRVPHTTTWDYFIEHLAGRFICPPEVLTRREEIMIDIKDLVQEFLTTSSDRADEASLFAMRRLFKFLQECYGFLEVCLYYFLFLRMTGLS